MPEEAPLVSIAMPARNSAATLELALRSIFEQTYPHWELLLMDDGSTDATAEIARSFRDPRIRIQSDGQWRGMTARMNEAIGLARGAFYARMDSDDVAYPQRLARQLAYLDEHPDVDLAGTWVVVFNDEGVALGKRAGAEAHTAICARPESGFLIVHPTFMARMDWMRAHPYDERLRYSQDQDLLMRHYPTSTYANVPEILLGYREGRLRLDKLLTGRREIAASFFRALWGRRERGLALRAAAEQGMKLAVDTLAVGSGLNHRLLRQRARPITAEERHQWEKVWHDLHDAA